MTDKERLEALLETMRQMKEVASDITAEIGSQEALGFYEQLSSVYEDTEYRHSYAAISKELGGYTPDVYTVLPYVLLSVLNLARQKRDDANAETYEQCKHVMQSIQKLMDHIELECIRLVRMKAVETNADRSKHYSEEVALKYQEMNDKWSKLKKKIASMQTQSVAILGIFAALVLGVSMEMTIFGQAFSNVTTQNIWVILALASCLGMIVFDTLFMLMFIIARIVDVDLAVKTVRKSTFVRYWYVIAINVVFLLSLGICMIVLSK